MPKTQWTKELENQVPEFIREARFVEATVDNLIKHHAKKIESTTPQLIDEDVIRTSGIADINKAMNHVKTLAILANKADENYKAAADYFNSRYCTELDELLNTADQERADTITRAIEDFNFRIRKAIGLVELVDPTEAFDVLEECRNEIHYMGKE